MSTARYVSLVVVTTLVATAVSSVRCGRVLAAESVASPVASPTASTPQALAIAYDQNSKSTLGAVALELLMPGAGSLYAGDGRGAMVTWGLMLTGVAALGLGWGMLQHEKGPAHSPTTPQNPEPGPQLALSDPSTLLMVAGAMAIVGGRVHGFVSATRGVSEFNDELRARIGIPVSFSVGVQPASGGGLAAGAVLHGRF